MSIYIEHYRTVLLMCL